MYKSVKAIVMVKAMVMVKATAMKTDTQVMDTPETAMATVMVFQADILYMQPSLHRKVLQQYNNQAVDSNNQECIGFLLNSSRRHQET